jgi:hypothetical protein
MLSMTTAVYLVMKIVFGAGVGLGLAIGTICWFGALWYAIPMIMKWKR